VQLLLSAITKAITSFTESTHHMVNEGQLSCGILRGKHGGLWSRVVLAACEKKYRMDARREKTTRAKDIVYFGNGGKIQTASMLSWGFSRVQSIFMWILLLFRKLKIAHLSLLSNVNWVIIVCYVDSYSVCQTNTIPEYLKTKYKRFDFPEKRHY
jgi:hypothetical protein